jgi:DNA polymerase elongation subunit (family B)
MLCHQTMHVIHASHASFLVSCVWSTIKLVNNWKIHKYNFVGVYWPYLSIKAKTYTNFNIG